MFRIINMTRAGSISFVAVQIFSPYKHCAPFLSPLTGCVNDEAEICRHYLRQ